MDVKKASEERRSLRSLESVEITRDMIDELAGAASLSPSCFNKQPWRFVFVRSREGLDRVFASLSRGNDWFKAASLVVGVFTAKELDCVVGRREYCQFDTGMAVGMMLLRATEMGLIAHPIAGFDEEAAAKALGVPGEAILVTIIAVGRKAQTLSPILSPHQIEDESRRPPRIPFEGFAREEMWS